MAGRKRRDEEKDLRRRLVSFDWALKRLLRSKANFDVLEGFLSELFRRDVTVLEILESEGNKDRVDDKFNRVDLKARLDGEEIVIVEVQAARERAFLQRILYGVSKVVTEHMDERDPYEKVPRVISVNVLFSPFGEGSETVYHGRMAFEGLRTGEALDLVESSRGGLRTRSVDEVFPEFYLLDVSRFDEVARDGLDEWIYFLKRGTVLDEFTAKGIMRARFVFDLMGMSRSDRIEYDHWNDGRRTFEGMVETARLEALEKGLEQGLEQGLERGLERGREEGERKRALEIARKMLDGHEDGTIAEMTGLSVDEVAALRGA